MYDVVIIGAGPVGMFSTFYAGMRQMNALLIDSLEQLGGQLGALYPEKYIYDVAGHPEILAKDLVSNLEKQMKRFEDSTTIALGEQVMEIVKNSDRDFTIKTNKHEYQTKSVIITAGNGSFSPRTMGLENESELTNIHYFVNDMKKFKDRDVVVFGGGDSAVDWALMLENIAKSVTIVHRRNEFRAHEHSVELLKSSSVNIMTPFVPETLTGENGLATAVTVKEVGGDEQVQTLSADDILVTYGFVSALGPIKDWGLNIERNTIPVDTAQQTNIDGIFACGDICTYPGKAKLIISGFGEAPIAINSAKKYSDPDAKIGVLHSSSVIGGH